MPQSGMARAKIYRRGMPGFFYDNGGVRVAWAWRLHKTCLTCLTCLTRWVRHCIPRGFAVPQFGLAWAKIYRRGMQWADLPQGNAMGRFTAGVMQWANLPQGYAGLFLWQRRFAVCVGVALA